MNYSFRSIQFCLTGIAMLMLFVFPVSSEGLSLYGSVSTEILAGVSEPDRGRGGFESEVRIVAETEADSSVVFRGEAGILLSYGLSSEPAIAFDSNAVTPPTQLPPGDDLHREFFIDQAWAETNLDHFSLQAGIIPVAWGSAYMYNPLSRITPPSIPGDTVDRAIGRPGMTLFLPLPAGFSAEGYILAAPRLTDPVPYIGELDSDSFPYGIKFQFQGTRIDAGLYALRESMTEGKAVYWYGADSTVIIGEATLYAEFAATPSLSMEVSAGGSYTIPVIEVIIRTEYIYLGTGETRESYDGASFLEGSTKMLGRQYLFLQLEKEDPRQAAWKVAAGTIVNIEDGSAALLAEALWRPVTDFSLGLFTRIFTARQSSTKEFGGHIPIAPGIAVYPYHNVVGLSAEWFF